jgi:hypothetical protein
MFLNNLEFFKLMLPTQDIQQYGGKGAILNHIRDNAPDIPIPDYVIKKQGQWLWSIRKELNILQRPLIVRSSSPYEYSDFEGIFDSITDVESKLDLREAIKRVEESATTKRAKKYAEQRSFDIGNKIHTIIQEQMGCKFKGAMIRHPNNPDLIFMNCYNGKSNNRDHYHYLFNTKTRREEENDIFLSLGISDDTACFLADAYERIEELKEIAEEETLYVEFGLNPFFVFQARPSGKIETADFEVPEADDSMLSTDLVFGITPQEGIVYPVLRSISYFESVKEARALYKKYFDGSSESVLHLGQLDQILTEGLLDWADHRSINIPTVIQNHNEYVDSQLGGHCLMMTYTGREKYDLDLSVPHMKAMITGGMQGFLTHDVMRLLKTADVTMGVNSLLSKDFYRNMPSGTEIRIISNGKRAIAMRE